MVEGSALKLSNFDEYLAEASGVRLASQPLRVEIVRTLEESDLAAPKALAQVPQLRQLKQSHHHLAKVLAAGKNNIEASRITAYNTEYIARLRNDPAFGELIEHYKNVDQLELVDYIGVMRAVGMEALSELRQRLEDAPAKFTISQLQETVKLLMIEPMKSEAIMATAQREGGGAAPAVRIEFVKPPAATIEGTYSRGDDEV